MIKDKIILKHETASNVSVGLKRNEMYEILIFLIFKAVNRKINESLTNRHSLMYSLCHCSE